MADLTPTEAAILKAAVDYVHTRDRHQSHGPLLSDVRAARELFGDQDVPHVRAGAPRRRLRAAHPAGGAGEGYRVNAVTPPAARDLITVVAASLGAAA